MTGKQSQQPGAMRAGRRSAFAPVFLLGALIALGSVIPAYAVEDASCRTVRLSDIGWTDVTTTTALVASVLRELGYEPQVTVLSVPVTYASMKNKDIDVFLGNWMPTQEGDRRAFVADGSVDVLDANLVGAKYTLAVPAYTYDAGLRDFADIQRFAAALNHSIYGIEPGNDGNRQILGIIAHHQFNLGDFKLIESSEQGMLAEVERAVRAHAPIVFLGWDPHPMNMRFQIRYLSGGDATFGPNYGGASVFTNTRAGYSAQCPNVGRLLMNLKFTPRGESEVMDAILNRHETPAAAAAAWLQANPAIKAQWLSGVRRFDGQPAFANLPAASALTQRAGFEEWMTRHKIPLGDTVAVMIEYVKAHGTVLFDGISKGVGSSVNGLTALLRAIPSPLLILLAAALAWVLHRSLALAAFVAAALLFIMNQGYWIATLETLSLVMLSALVSALIGVPLGIAAAHRPRLYAAMRPVLDLMQTLPTFVYLIPTLVLFGLGVVPGLISTVIFALPASIRLTYLGISSVPRSLIEAGQAFGATGTQMLFKIELPSAAATILAGMTQCIMLCLSMVVIAALVGAGGLGVPVVRALNTVQIGMGFEAGFAIVLLAIILDRISRPSEKKRS
ncbi:MAG TPA: choline ABC transporter permease subunit [Steroidobacteraceae bacterium]|jgi:glycine betaine/proline transport system substrate-binding protein|nr:choline ABC transporter permease subunit [Steroidobacteraceae bacterium]